MKREAFGTQKSHLLSFLLFLVLSSILAAPLAAQSRGITLRIDNVGTENFLQKNQLVFYVDLLAGDLSVVPKLPSDSIKVFIKDKPKPLEGTFIIQSFSEIRESVAVVIVFASHQDFVEPVRNEKGEESVPLELVKQGVINFLGQLDGIDKVAIYQYNETGKEKIFPFSNVSNSAAENVRNFAKGREFDESKKKGEVSYPAFYKHLKDIIEKDIGEEPNLPRRKIMLVISDGMDKNK
ncbi:MAG: hypothetical protein FJ088_03805, partial [Deltaproteobacteria bacterium]|nr:hypothetical protein [Deltaproteobacteria bacterium]